MAGKIQMCISSGAFEKIVDTLITAAQKEREYRLEGEGVCGGTEIFASLDMLEYDLKKKVKEILDND